MGGNFSAVATLLLKEVRSADPRASTPPAAVTAASTPDPALANRNCPHNPRAADRGPTHVTRRRDRRAWPRRPLTATPADGCRSTRHAAPPAAAPIDHPHFPGRISSAQRLAAEPPRGPGEEPPLNTSAAGSTTSTGRRDSAVGSSRVLCSAPEWMKTVPNPGPTSRCRTAP